MRQNHEFKLLINSEGDYVPFKESYKDLWMEHESVRHFIAKTHISLSINEMITDLIGDIGTEEAMNAKILSHAEVQVIEAMRENNVKEITVRFNKKEKPDLLLVEKKEDVGKSARIMDLIMSHGYQDITLKTENGNVISCSNITKQKLK